MHHAYIIVGGTPSPRRALAFATAQALVCTSPVDGSGCGQCAGCRKLAGGNHPDVVHVTPNDNGVILIDTVREAAGRLALKATESRVKLIIVEHADRMNPQAQNAFLKTLE